MSPFTSVNWFQNIQSELDLHLLLQLITTQGELTQFGGGTAAPYYADCRLIRPNFIRGDSRSSAIQQEQAAGVQTGWRRLTASIHHLAWLLPAEIVPATGTSCTIPTPTVAQTIHIRHNHPDLSLEASPNWTMRLHLLACQMSASDGNSISVERVQPELVTGLSPVHETSQRTMTAKRSQTELFVSDLPSRNTDLPLWLFRVPHYRSSFRYCKRNWAV